LSFGLWALKIKKKEKKKKEKRGDLKALWT
jgi:hypothetical protein